MIMGSDPSFPFFQLHLYWRLSKLITKIMNKNLRKAFSLAELSIMILVIVILVAAITKGSQLYVDIKLVGARNVTKSSIVNSLNGLTLWLEATSSDSFDKENLAEGDKVNIWRNINPQLTNKFDVEQTNDSQKPIYKKSGLNGLPAIFFDGANRLIKDSLKLSELSSDNSNSIFIVQNHDSSKTYSTTFSWVSSGSSVQYRFIVHAPHGGTFYYDFGYTGGSGWRSNLAVPSNFSNIPKIITAIKNKSSVEARINGAQPFLINNSASATINKSITGNLSIGSYYVGSDYFKGLIAEIIFFNRALNERERKSVEDYLSQKWDIKLNRN